MAIVSLCCIMSVMIVAKIVCDNAKKIGYSFEKHWNSLCYVGKFLYI